MGFRARYKSALHLIRTVKKGVAVGFFFVMTSKIVIYSAGMCLHITGSLVTAVRKENIVYDKLSRALLAMNGDVIKMNAWVAEERGRDFSIANALGLLADVTDKKTLAFFVSPSTPHQRASQAVNDLNFQTLY